MIKGKTMKCMLIEMTDKKKFFVCKKEFSRLKEFIKTFKPKVFIVETSQENIIKIEDLPKKICATEPSQKKIDYKILEEIKENKENKRRNKNEEIRFFIEKEINNKNPISIKKIKERYKKASSSTLYNQIRAIKNELQKKGYILIKNKEGNYEKKRIKRN